jgi:capsular polysaccharide transport system permease protein
MIGADQRSSPAERLVSHIDIILALAARDIRGRFGENSLGYAWTYATPLAWVGATYLAFYILGRRIPVYTDTITFIISGLIPYAAFRYTVTTLGRVNSAMRGLLIFPSVTLEHGVITAALLEFVNTFVVFAFVAGVNFVVFGNWEMDNPAQFVAGIALAWGLGASYGYLFSVLGRYNPTIQQLSVVILRPTYFLSAVFFTANEVPPSLAGFIFWNPLVHAIDIARDGMLFHYQSRVASPEYVIVWIIALAGSGVLISSSRRV